MTDTTLSSSAPAPAEGVDTNAGAAAGTLLDGAGQNTGTTEAGGDGAPPVEQAAGDQEQQQEGDTPTGAPDEYEAFTLPEGVTLDPEVNGNLQSLAKELNLDQAQAQKVADLGAQLSQKWTGALHAQIEQTSQAWAEAAKADPEIGGDKLAENLSFAKTTLDRLGTPELRELLTATRLGNNPEMIRLLVNVGRAVSDDNRITSGKPSGGSGQKSMSERMYPSSSK